MEGINVGINFENIKSKVKESNENSSKVNSREKRNVGSTRKNNQTKKTPQMQKSDYISAAKDVTVSVIGLLNTIGSARQELKRMELSLQEKQLELDLDLEKLKNELTLNLAKLEADSEEKRELTKVKLKEIDANSYDMVETEVTKRMQIEKNHEERMHVLETQRQMLTKVMEIYTKYYDYLFMGRTDIQFPADLPGNIQMCISTLNTALQTNTHLPLTHKDSIIVKD